MYTSLYDTALLPASVIGILAQEMSVKFFGIIDVYR